MIGVEEPLTVAELPQKGQIGGLTILTEEPIVLPRKDLSGCNSMTESRLPKLVIFGDPKKGDVGRAIAEFSDFAKGRAETIASGSIEECTADVLKNADFAVVFGGDGTIISAARHLSECSVPVVGVNLGKLGYLAEFSIEELKEFFERIVRGQAGIEKRMMLRCCVSGGGRDFSSAAINDIFINAGPPFSMIELKISVSGQPLASCVSDGLVICTPTGSTAYNLSSGGPIVTGSMEAMVVTPLCPHSLSFRPIVMSADRVVEVVGVQVNEGTTVSVDGQMSCRLTPENIVTVQRHKGEFLVVNNPVRTQWDTLGTKLGWAEKPKYKKG